jgi:hypothetical protein
LRLRSLDLGELIRLDQEQLGAILCRKLEPEKR